MAPLSRAVALQNPRSNAESAEPHLNFSFCRLRDLCDLRVHPIPTHHIPHPYSPSVTIDLDHNATTRPSDAVVAAIAASLKDSWHNPSSVHRAGQAARRDVELARQSIANLIAAKPRQIVFTSGGTEAIDLAIRGSLDAIAPQSTRRTLITTRVEHAGVRELADRLIEDHQRLHPSAPPPVLFARLKPDGLVDLDHLASLLNTHSALCSIQWANNETGAIQPVREIAQLCRASGTLFHCDATQWIGKMPARVPDHPDPTIDCDLLTFSPHKFHGPKGVGILWSRRGTRLRPLTPGSQELGRRGGTENVPGIVGAGVAAEEAARWLEDPSERTRLGSLLDTFEQTIRKAIPDAVVNAPADRNLRLWNTLNIAFPRLEAEAILLLLSEQGLWASAGAACSSGSLEPSPVLLAMGIPPEVAHGSVRFSIGKETTAEQLEMAAQIVTNAVQRLRQSGGH